MNNGTVFFMDLGDGPFGVTAQHVVQGLRQDLANYIDVRVQVANEFFNPSDEIISESIQKDIVTFAISPSELESLGVQAHRPERWPAKPPQQGRGVILGGFRGFERIQNGLQLEWGFCHGLGPATSVHHDTIAIQFEREEWEQIEGLPEPQPSTPYLSGMHGHFCNPERYTTLASITPRKPATWINL